MSQIMNIAATGMAAANTAIELHAQNIAAAKVVAGNRIMPSFSDLAYRDIKTAGVYENAASSRRPIGTQLGTGVKLDGTFRDLQQGPVVKTGQPFDIMIRGAGYFAVGLPNGLRGFTRAGNFQIDAATRRLVDNRGNPLDANGDLVIPDDIDINQVTISLDGAVTGVDAQNNQVDIGQLTLFTFANEKGLKATGDNTFLSTEASGDEIELVDLNDKFVQGSLEGSNVSIVTEMTDMITSSRLYELNAKVIKVADDMQSSVISIKS